MKKNNNIYYLYWFLFFIFLFIIFIIVYAYNSGSCKINKKYICNNDFCLYKEFKIYLQDIIKNEISILLSNKEIQKRVNIETFPETLLNCALPNKKGITISTLYVVKYAPNIINFYQNSFCLFRYVCELYN